MRLFTADQVIGAIQRIPGFGKPAAGRLDAG
jgi:hypothetical protein